MNRTTFNEGWAFRPKTNRFAEMSGRGAEWTPVTLPHDALIGAERSPSGSPATGYFPGGVWEYRKTLDVASGDARSVVVLEFEGVYREAVVSVNGTIAAHRPYGYSNFFVEIGHLLRTGVRNDIAVEAQAHEDSRWYSGAGIYRNVWLLRSGSVHFTPDLLEVRTPEIGDDGAVVTIAAAIRNTSDSTAIVTLRAEVVEADGTVVARQEAPVTLFPGESVTARQRLYVDDPHRWGPDDPYLYTCRISLHGPDGGEVIDEEAATFGFRSLSVDAVRGLRINDDPVLLRGACVHHDNGPIGAATIDRAEVRRVELLKAAGFNAIRSAHNPMSKAMLDACDRLGVLVMDETFDMWLQTKSADDYALRFDQWWETDVEAMVRKDINHPSVVMYSIGNEIPDGSTEQGVHVGRALAAKVRSLDDTRFVTQAVSGLLVGGPDLFAAIRQPATPTDTDAEAGVNTAATNLGELLGEAMKSPVVAEKTAEAFSYLDVAGYNYMEKRFPIDCDLYPNRVIVASETHPSAVDTGWAGVTSHPNVIGDFTWTGWDYIGEAGIGRIEYGEERPELGMLAFQGDYPWLTAWCGDIDITGRRRPQSYYREIVFGLSRGPFVAVLRPEHNDREVVHASPWSWSDVVSGWTWDGYEGKPITIEVYADADEVELMVNGRSVGRRPAGEKQRFRAEFATTYEPGELSAVAWHDGREIGRTTLRSAKGPVVLDVRVDRAEISAEPSDLAFVELALVDDSGALHHSSDRSVTVQIDGPGVLQGLASANPVTEEPFTGAQCTTFDGRALAIVRPTAEGTITVLASAQGCDPQRLQIEARR